MRTMCTPKNSFPWVCLLIFSLKTFDFRINLIYLWTLLIYPDRMEDFNQIVTNWFNSLRSPFINYIHKRIPALSLDDIEDIYSDTFIAIRKNLLEGKVAEGTKWKAYIFQIGYNMAINKTKETSRFVSPSEDNSNDDDIDADNRFDTLISLKDVAREEENETKQERLEILEREIKYLPEPCETILKDFYYGGFSMAEIMAEIHYQSTNSVKAMKNRCMNKLKERVRLALGMLNL